MLKMNPSRLGSLFLLGFLIGMVGCDAVPATFIPANTQGEATSESNDGDNSGGLTTGDGEDETTQANADDAQTEEQETTDDSQDSDETELTNTDGSDAESDTQDSLTDSTENEESVTNDKDDETEVPENESEGSSTSSGVAVPAITYCNDVADWPDGWIAFEEEVLVLVNNARSTATDCGSRGTFPAASPLTMEGALTCAARIHSLDMATNNFFDHTNLSGESPGDRVDQTGYSWSTWGENIALGQITPEQVVNAWLDSDGHCANIMNASFTQIGIGYSEGNYWTQVFGAPR
ncbi:MAG: CAP domain-containing protein [Phycisphaerae bacterium]